MFNQKSRPPKPWLMDFTYFDKLHTGYDTSNPTEYASREAAVAAAQGAQSENGGSIVVTSARAYPKSTWFRWWRTKRFTFSTRYSRH